jgi:hypothetical protein
MQEKHTALQPKRTNVSRIPIEYFPLIPIKPINRKL